jgi:hypothetical protein
MARFEFSSARLADMPSRCGSRSLFLVGFAFCILAASLFAPTMSDANWSYYGGDAGGMRYSRLTQFNPQNVSKLKVACVFHTGDVSDGKHGKQRSGFESTQSSLMACDFCDRLQIE